MSAPLWRDKGEGDWHGLLKSLLAPSFPLSLVLLVLLWIKHMLSKTGTLKTVSSDSLQSVEKLTVHLCCLWWHHTQRSVPKGTAPGRASAVESILASAHLPGSSANQSSFWLSIFPALWDGTHLCKLLFSLIPSTQTRNIKSLLIASDPSHLQWGLEKCGVDEDRREIWEVEEAASGGQLSVGVNTREQSRVTVRWLASLAWLGQWLHIKQQNELGVGGTHLGGRWVTQFRSWRFEYSGPLQDLCWERRRALSATTPIAPTSWIPAPLSTRITEGDLKGNGKPGC